MRSTGAPPAKSAVPRTPDGKPDLTGVWQGNSKQRGTWEEANTGLGVGGTGVDPSAPANPSSSDPIPGGEAAPYQPWAAQKVVEAFNRRGIDDPTTHCLPPGLPRANNVSLFPIQIVHTPKQIVFLYEYMSLFRVIPLNAKHPDDLLPSYMGNSVGRWEGDTLVVDVIGFNDKTWLAGAGTFHSDALHITERYTRIDKDQINYDVTIEDPNVLTKPWTMRSSLMLREGTRLQEYVCAENNLGPDRFEKLLKEGVDFRRP
ncbi:MAG: hypothetical protein A3G25_13975 [Betaproteobacteria bacterium RIFCSPLOWO2_12_FULL_63_13]|nr:MAG: hypothetical protein A3G25_13975 [Betaproteobacteria bacterium RIFCSPLOWO2_12_FULL_63_13]